jgi:aspartate/methionine/tyrosine aminotransferase
MIHVSPGAQAVRAASVPPFHAMAMSALASDREAAGSRVLHLEVGQPSTPLPDAARRAVIAEMERGNSMGYTNAAGLMSLRRAIADRYHQRHGVEVDPLAVTVVAGASAGFTLAFMAAFDVGDAVGVLEPGYPCYRNALVALGVQPIAVPVGADTRWSPTVAHLDAAAAAAPGGRLRGLVIASPSNPTGTLLDGTALRTIADWCDAHGTQLIADEIYHGITYGASAVSITEVSDRAVVINSFSKYFSMTGWRLGWMVVPRHLRDAVERLQQNFYICASHVAQVAGLAALGAEAAVELDAHVHAYARRREVLISGVRAAGFTSIADADGAFYVYTDASHLTDALRIDSLALCRRWLADVDVCATPGLDFDLRRGGHFVRFSYAGDSADIAEACARLQAWQS